MFRLLSIAENKRGTFDIVERRAGENEIFDGLEDQQPVRLLGSFRSEREARDKIGEFAIEYTESSINRSGLVTFVSA